MQILNSITPGIDKSFWKAHGIIILKKKVGLRKGKSSIQNTPINIMELAQILRNLRKFFLTAED